MSTTVLVCSEPGCSKAPRSKGMCHTHYARDYARRCQENGTLGVCSSEGCGRPVRARMLCAMHHMRARRGKEPFLVESLKAKHKAPRPVGRDGNDRLWERQGLCATAGELDDWLVDTVALSPGNLRALRVCQQCPVFNECASSVAVELHGGTIRAGRVVGRV